MVVYDASGYIIESGRLSDPYFYDLYTRIYVYSYVKRKWVPMNGT